MTSFPAEVYQEMLDDGIRLEYVDRPPWDFRSATVKIRKGKKHGSHNQLTHGRGRGSKFTPAKSMKEAEEWAESKGIAANWQLSGGRSAPEFTEASSGESVEEYKITLDQVNEIQGALHPLMEQYPEVKLDGIGTYYHMDNNIWNANMNRNIREDKENYTGKRWTRSQAETRVRKIMIDEPTPAVGVGGRPYSPFRLGEYAHGGLVAERKLGKAIRVNHVSMLLSSHEKSEAHRASRFERRKEGKKSGTNVENIGDDPKSLAQHEFAHAIAFKYEMHTHHKMRKLHKSFSADEVERGLSSYATTNIKEFIAEGFTEGLRKDSRPIGREVKRVMDEIVAESRK